MYWFRITFLSLLFFLFLAASPERSQGKEKESDDLIEWISGACPAATDADAIVRLDQVSEKAVTEWLRTGRFRDALELALVYHDCLDEHEFIDGTQGLIERFRTLQQIICFIPMVVIETEQGIDPELTRRSLKRCPAPVLEPPDESAERASWAEDVRRYIHLTAAVESPEKVLGVSTGYRAALEKAGFTHLGSDVAATDKRPDSMFAAQVFAVGASVASGKLERLVEETGGEDPACNSNFLTALGLMHAFQLERMSALPIILKALMSRARFDDLVAVTREAKNRFAGRACVVPGTVASLVLSTLDGEAVDRLVGEDRVKDLALIASSTSASIGVPGSLASRLKVTEWVVKGTTKAQRGRWLSILGEAQMEGQLYADALASFDEARGLLDEGDRWPAVRGAFMATISAGRGREEQSGAARRFLEIDPQPLVIFEVIQSQKGPDESVAAIGSLRSALDTFGKETRKAVAEAMVKVVDVEPGTPAASAAVETVAFLGIPGDTQEQVVWGLVVGRHFLKADDTESAKKAINRSLKFARPNMESAVSGLQALVRWLAMEKRYGMLDHVIERSGPSHLIGPAVLAQVSSIVGEAGRRKKAKALLRSATLRGPGKDGDWLAIAGAYARIDEPALAAGALAKVGPSNSWGPGPWMTKGRIEMTRKRYRDAASAYGKAADLSRGACEPLFFRGLVRLLLGDPEGSERDFDRCIEMGDGSHQVYGGLGYARFDQSRFDDALAAFVKALEMDGQTADNHLGLALTYLRKGLIVEARESYRRAVELEPSMERGHGEAEKRGYVYSEVEKKAWDDLLEEIRKTE